MTRNAEEKIKRVPTRINLQKVLTGASHRSLQRPTTLNSESSPLYKAKRNNLEKQSGVIEEAVKGQESIIKDFNNMVEAETTNLKAEEEAFGCPIKSAERKLPQWIRRE